MIESIDDLMADVRCNLTPSHELVTALETLRSSYVAVWELLDAATTTGGDVILVGGHDG